MKIIYWFVTASIVLIGILTQGLIAVWEKSFFNDAIDMTQPRKKENNSVKNLLEFQSEEVSCLI